MAVSVRLVSEAAPSVTNTTIVGTAKLRQPVTGSVTNNEFRRMFTAWCVAVAPLGVTREMAFNAALADAVVWYTVKSKSSAALESKLMAATREPVSALLLTAFGNLSRIDPVKSSISASDVSSMEPDVSSTNTMSIGWY